MKRLIGALIFFLCQYSFGYAQLDSNLVTNNIVSDTSKVLNEEIIDTVKGKEFYAGIYQWRLGIDLAALGFNIANPNKQSYEFQLDFKDRDKRYWVAEVGYGRGKVDFSHLAYNTHSTFVRIGLDQSMFNPQFLNDFDLVYLGVRYGASFGQRAEATYAFDSPFGGTFTGRVESQPFFVHWGEISAGMKLEVWKRCFIGWNVRAKFLFNGNQFKEIKPNHIAGYGSADKATNFDVNLFVSYAIFRYNK